jgi:hypothetical protein
VSAAEDADLDVDAPRPSEDDATAKRPSGPPDDAPVLAEASAKFDVPYVRRAFDRVRRVSAPRGRVVVRIATSATLVALIGAWAFGGTPGRADYRPIATLMAAAVFGVPPFIRRMVALRIWRAEPQRDGTVVYQFLDEGLRIRAPKSAGFFPYDALAKAARFPDGLVVTTVKDGTGYFVPAEGFGEPEALERAAEILLKRVPTYRAFRS